MLQQLQQDPLSMIKEQVLFKTSQRVWKMFSL